MLARMKYDLRTPTPEVLLPASLFQAVARRLRRKVLRVRGDGGADELTKL